MNALAHVCAFSEPYFAQSHEKFTNDSIVRLIEDFAPSFNDTMFECEWKYKISRCDDLFVPTFTGNGLCFVFNALNSNHVYTEK